jgi:hypothetical protein
MIISVFLIFSLSKLGTNKMEKVLLISIEEASRIVGT